MAGEIKDKPVRKVYPDSIVISNVKSKIDNTTTSYTVVVSWYDGTSMDDSKVDQWGIYSKYKETGEYLKENKPQWGELFLEVDTVADLRAISAYHQFLIKIGYYKGVRLGGYYIKGDTTGAIDYFISLTSASDDGGSIFQLSGLKLEHDFRGYINVKHFGASSTLAPSENYNKIKNALACLNRLSGGEIEITSDINYNYKRNDISTFLPVKNYTQNDIIIIDKSIGNSYEGQSRDGAQYRIFYCTKGGSADGFTDTQGFWQRGDWHPYVMLSNDEDPLTAKRRHATVFFCTNGVVNWGIGQGISTRENVGVNEDSILEQFKIIANGIGTDAGLTAIMAVNKTDGKWGFNHNTPVTDYHFNCRRKATVDEINGAFRAVNGKGGDFQFQLGTGTQIRRFVYEQATNNIRLTDVNGATVWIWYNNGNITLGSDELGVDIKQGTAAPNNLIPAKIGSLYFRKGAPSNGTGVFFKYSGNNTSSGWMPFRPILSGTTTEINSINKSYLTIGQDAFNTDEKFLKVFDGTDFVPCVPAASTTKYGTVKKSAKVDSVTAQDAVVAASSTATDIAGLLEDFNQLVEKYNTAVVELNAVKAQLNAKLQADINSLQQEAV